MNPERILIFNHRHMGDVLMTTPAMWSLREHFPKSRIDCITNNIGKQVLRAQNVVNNIYMEDELDSFAKSERYDLALLFKATFRNSLLAKRLKIKKRVGRRMECNQFLLTDSIKTSSLHWIHRNNELLSPLGISKVTNGMKYVIPEIKDTPQIKKPFIVLNPGATTKTNRWPPASFARLSNLLMESLPHNIVITGTEDDSANAREIVRQTIAQKRIYNLTGTTPIEHLAYVLKNAAAVVTGDTGPMHLAIAVGSPNVVAIFGPADEATTGPLPNYGIVLAKDKHGGWRKSNPNLEKIPVSSITPEEVLGHLVTEHWGHIWTRPDYKGFFDKIAKR